MTTSGSPTWSGCPPRSSRRYDAGVPEELLEYAIFSGLRGYLMKVLVNGDRGYVGAVLVPVVPARPGHEVVGLDAGWYDGCDFGPPPRGLRVAHR